MERKSVSFFSSCSSPPPPPSCVSFITSSFGFFKKEEGEGVDIGAGAGRLRREVVARGE